MTYRTEVSTGGGGFGFDNFSLQEVMNDICDYVSNQTRHKFKHWFKRHQNEVNAHFVCENLECTLEGPEYCYVVVH